MAGFSRSRNVLSVEGCVALMLGGATVLVWVAILLQIGG